jgi:hypothetical protein
MKYLLITTLVIIALTLSSGEASAAESSVGYVPLTGIYGVTDSLNDTSVSSEARLSSMLGNIFVLLIGFAGLAAVVMISYGAIEYMVSESLTNKGAGREKILNAVIGLLLVLFTYTILYTINPDILSLRLFVTDIAAPSTNTTSGTGGTQNSQTTGTGGTNNTAPRPPTGIERTGTDFVYALKTIDPRGRCKIQTSSFINRQQCEAALPQAQATVSRTISAGGKAELTTGGCVPGKPTPVTSC